MGWDDGPELPREPTHVDTRPRATGRRGLILVMVAVDVLIGIAVILYFVLR